MVADKAERRMRTKDSVFWKPVGKYGDIMNNEKEEKEEKKDNHRKTEILRKKTMKLLKTSYML